MSYERPKLITAICLLLSSTVVLTSSTHCSAQSSPPGTGRGGVSNKLSRVGKGAGRPAVASAAVDKDIGIEIPRTMIAVTAQTSDVVRLKLRSYSEKSYRIANPADTTITAPTPTAAIISKDFSVNTSDCDPVIPAFSKKTADTPTAVDQKAPASCTVVVTFKPSQTGPETFTLDINIESIPNDGTAPLLDHVRLYVTGIGSNKCQMPNAKWLPLGRGDVTEGVVNCYYSSSNFVDVATQVKYEYDPVGDANDIGADLISAHFMPGFSLALEGNAVQNSCSATSSSTTTNTSCTQTSSGTAQSIQQAADSLEKGGQFGIRVEYPFLEWRNTYFHARVLASPRFSFNINGLGQQTANDSTNFIPLVAGEGYFEWDAISSTGDTDSPLGIFLDVRPGFEHLDSEYAAYIGIPKDKNTFHLNQVSVGLLVFGSFTLSGQHYWGPNQSFVDSSGNTPPVNNFGWTFRLQLAPKSLAK